MNTYFCACACMRTHLQANMESNCMYFTNGMYMYIYACMCLRMQHALQCSAWVAAYLQIPRHVEHHECELSASRKQESNAHSIRVGQAEALCKPACVRPSVGSVFIHTCIHTYICTHTYIHAYMHTYVPIHMHTFVNKDSQSGRMLEQVVE